MTLVLSLRRWLCSLFSRLFLLVLVGSGLAASVQAEPLVVLVSSERSPAYAEATEALIAELEQGGLARSDILDLSVAELSAQGSVNPKLFIALGLRAATQLMAREGRPTLLCTLLPRHSFERLLQQAGRKTSATLSALYLDQPVARQLDLIRLALPQVRRVGVVWGADSQTQAFDLLAAMPARGLRGVSPNVAPGEPVYPALKKVLDEAEVLLAVPDPQIYNSNTIQNLLLATFRANLPMVAFSPAYVKAGALLAVYTTPGQIGRQAAGLARNVLAGRPLPVNPQFPQEFSVGVNEHVARSLGFNLDVEHLNERLHQMEKTP